METLFEPWLATARSRIVSLLKSPTATEIGKVPTPKLTAGGTNVPLPIPKSMETSLETIVSYGQIQYCIIVKVTYCN